MNLLHVSPLSMSIVKPLSTFSLLNLVAASCWWDHCQRQLIPRDGPASSHSGISTNVCSLTAATVEQSLLPAGGGFLWGDLRLTAHGLVTQLEHPAWLIRHVRGHSHARGSLQILHIAGGSASRRNTGKPVCKNLEPAATFFSWINSAPGAASIWVSVWQCSLQWHKSIEQNVKGIFWGFCSTRQSDVDPLKPDSGVLHTWLIFSGKWLD